MAYQCPRCGYSSEEPDNCPVCNIPLKEAKDVEGEE